uniref:urokinase plasminogen activator surface receptor isoform X2 n=1 Tax=Jaculus jaculus TaxID=51337 RepID=UPI001E1B2D50|nr:urokinase plasminogen activator surface receptor isoform X2 [Jaculus jaculus]
MGHRLPLSLCSLLLLIQTCVPAALSLRCLKCDRNQKCQVEECALGQNLCRTTILREWEEELKVVTRGCAHSEKTNRTMSYRSGAKIISLMETVCGENLCNRPRTGSQQLTFARGRYRECVSCTSSDLSCERGREQNLQCRYPGEQCLDVVTHQSVAGRMDENYIRGCGSLPGCPGQTGFHNNHTFHFLRCCNSSQCNQGPVLVLQHLPMNGVQCYSCEGNSTHGCSSEHTSLIDCRGPMNQCLEATGSDGLDKRRYTVRGCATSSWCEGSHMVDTFDLTHLNVTCCTGSGCNSPLRDVQHRRGAAPRLRPVHFSLSMCLLTTIRLWGGTLLWT